MLGVEPDGFGIERGFFRRVQDCFSEIHYRVGTVDALESESGGKLLEGEELAVVLGRPAEQAEEVDEGLGQEAGIAISCDADDGAGAALGELGPVGSAQQRKMGELWRGNTDGLGAKGLE